MSPARLADVLTAVERLWPSAVAEPWDAIGLVCGDPEAGVRRILLAVDPVAATAEEAIEARADLLLTHHPIFLTPVHGVAATTAKGRVVHRLIAAGCALHVAHTNADAADPGVSDALAEAIGLRDLRPLAPAPAPEDKLVTFVPREAVDPLVDALAAAGAGQIGAYDRCAWFGEGTGTFRPGAAANPTIGARGRVERVPETRVEMVLPRDRRRAVVTALRAAHPYEEPAFDVYEVAADPARARTGLGRIGHLPEPEPLAAFADRVAAALPATAGGVRLAGDPRRPVRQVAVCGGAGDFLLDAARRAGVDAYLTADLRHHRAGEALEDGGPALLDVAHWASEWPWLPVAARRLAAELAPAGDTVEIAVSTRVTDPWTSHVRSPR